MKILIIGSGGREHALAWKIARDPGIERVIAAPGSAGIGQVAECVGVGVGDIEGLAALARERGADLTLVGPEAPLAAGVVDRFRADGLRVVGPDRAGAQLEASKAFTKQLLVEARIPTAAYRELTEATAARSFARELGFPVVVKADGLAAGKGVVICQDEDEADRAIGDMLEHERFGAAGRRIVIEEFLEGEEASFIALTDGRNVLPLAPSQDHKAVLDGDRGPNTGGMGAYSPAPVVDARMADEITARIIEPTVAALAERGIVYRGVLYAGLMIRDCKAKVLEFNVRFGDPECQPLMMRLRSSLTELLVACADGTLDHVKPVWDTGAAVCVVMASAGYPGSYETGQVISGLEAAERVAGVEVFHAGTDRDEQGRWVTAGGRVLGVTAVGPTVAAAAKRSYEAVARIGWEGAHYRRDIGHRAMEKRQT